MNPIDELKRLARAKRDEAIAQANATYKKDIEAVAVLSRRLSRGDKPRWRLRRGKEGPLSGVKCADAAESVLRELGPLTIQELVVAVQERGLRAGDDPRKLANAVRTAMRYHRDRFERMGAKWRARNVL